MVGVLLLSPTLGAWADRTGNKNHQLTFWVLIGSIATMTFFWVTPGRISTLSYEMSLVFYNAFLKEICVDEEAGTMSGLGFALGYIGGGLCLGLNIIMIFKPAWLGIRAGEPLFLERLGFFVVGVWWLLFSLPHIFWVKDRKRDMGSNGKPLTDEKLLESLKQLFRERNVRNFLLSYLIYNDGIQTILIMASIFGAQALGMSPVQLGFCFLLIQFVAFWGALVCGKWADRWSHKNVVLLTLAVYGAVVLWGVFMKTTIEFWLLGIVVGLILGGSQAASRSLFSLLVPAARSGESFALFSVVGKASSLVGPFMFGLINQVAGLRAAVGSLLIFFVVGGALLFFVKEKKTFLPPKFI
jgi:UMF1 family MFS transporter